MNWLALGVSVFGFSCTLFGIALYFSKLLKNRVPVIPVGLILSLLVGMMLGAYGTFLAVPGSILSVLSVAMPAVLSLCMGALFLWILSQKKTPIGKIKIKVGDLMPLFETTTYRGERFTDSDLKGKRTLFKFYRGSWCPYCCRELKMFEEMKSDLDAFGVQVVALSGDTVDQANTHVGRDDISHLLLADPDLDVIRHCGVEHHKALGADSKNIKTIFGMPFPQLHQLKFKSMSIPTSLLIDEAGVIRWIDQSEDYRLRANQERIMAAIKDCFAVV